MGIWKFNYHDCSRGKNRNATSLRVTLNNKKFKTSDIEVCPNRYLNNVNIQLSTSVKIAELICYEFTGRLVRIKQGSLFSEINFNTDEKESRIYSLR
ncbi:hypothetical protein BTO06_05730 [Tenacibaculum sp. SZ-18]|nr:hypothetical protein BTO06_05730 [Tenacibaculum sp. SZ-18]